jgi:hypothetical protein
MEVKRQIDHLTLHIVEITCQIAEMKLHIVKVNRPDARTTSKPMT